MRVTATLTLLLSVIAIIVVSCAQRRQAQTDTPVLVPSGLEPPIEDNGLEDYSEEAFPDQDQVDSFEPVSCSLRMSSPEVSVGEVVAIGVAASEGAMEATINGFSLNGRNTIVLRAMMAGTFRVTGGVTFNNGQQATCSESLTIQNKPATNGLLTHNSQIIRRMPIYRFWNGKDHFYTLSLWEGWRASYKLERIEFSTSPIPYPGMQEIYRCYVPSNHDHFISVRSDCEGQTGEGSLGFVWIHGPRMIWRAYHPHTGDHFYTTDRAEFERAVNVLGYKDEGHVGAAL